MEPIELSKYFLSATVLAPFIFALIFPFLKEPQGDGKNIHLLAFTFAAFLFLFTLFPWCPNFSLATSQETYSWFPSLGISFALGVDGLSWTLVVLTSFLVLMAVLASKTSITKRLRFYYSMLFTLTGAIIGVFLARDLFLFFLFWELELVPMYFLIAIWGGPRRDYAAMKFVLYTLFGSIFLVAALLGVYFLLHNIAPAGQIFLFDSLTAAVQNEQIPLTLQVLLFTGFFITFAVKLPMVPFHTWLPDAHVEAPTPISMLLAGILLKMGAYGLLRLGFGMFPVAVQSCAPTIALLAFINIVYTAGVALVQKDLKKLIAYSSVSHMGFVLLGLAALNDPGYQGAVFVMISHGIVSAAMFMCVGTLYVRTHTREISEYGGFGAQTPIIFYFFMLMAMASLGLPLLISFPGESLVLYGAFLSNTLPLGTTHLLQWDIPWTMKAFTILSAIGVILGAAYLLWMLKKVFFGPIADKWKTIQDATFSEISVLTVLAIFVIYFGLNPQWLIAKFDKDVTYLLPTGEVSKMISQRHWTGGPH